MNYNKMKIISVLVFPFEREFVVSVVRARDYFTYPMKMKTYAVSYNSDHVESFFHWVQILERLNEVRIFKSMQDRSKNKPPKWENINENQ